MVFGRCFRGKFEGHLLIYNRVELRTLYFASNRHLIFQNKTRALKFLRQVFHHMKNNIFGSKPRKTWIRTKGSLVQESLKTNHQIFITKQEAPSSLYSCTCVHMGSCTTMKPVIVQCDATIAYVTLVVAASVVTNQSRRLEPEVLKPEMDFRHLVRSKLKY